MSDMPLMKCGHVAQGTRQSDQQPVCVVCAGLTEGWDIPADEIPNLEGRRSKCTYNRGKNGPVNNEAHTVGSPSGWGLPFFVYKPDEEFDQHYCGCWGWD